MPPIDIRLFGAPQVARGGKAVAVARRKSLALLAYLAVTQQPHARDALAALLWPELDRVHGYATLRNVLLDLHGAIGREALTLAGDQVALGGEPGVTVDVVRFRVLAAQVAAQHPPGRPPCDGCLAALAEATALYRGDFLAGFTLPDAEEFDAWQTLETEGLRLALADLLERLAAGLASRQQLDDALAAGRRWLALNPLSEAAHQALMELYARSGDRAAAARQYEECVRILKAELGVEPAPETTALYRAVRASYPAPPSASPAPIQPAPPAVHLPVDPTAFIGRQAELAQVLERLADPDCRLLTIIGPGGMGKTRLAIHAARAAAASFADGVFFVDLIPLSSAEQLASAVLQALHAQHRAADPGRYLVDYLAERQVLLLLDNFEHLLSGPEDDAHDATRLAARLVSGAPQVKLLVTSRGRLNLTAEWLVTLEGMRVAEEGREPEAQQAAPMLAGIEQDDAGALFLACLRRLRPAFQPTAGDAHLIGRICWRLGGMPLAIELAAAWTRLLGLADIAAEVERGSDVLQASAHDAPARHRSLAAVFDGSWALLSPRQRSLLRQMAVFRGDFDRRAAEAVAGASLPDLAALADASWLRLDTGDRLRMHPLAQQYCAARLAAEHERECGEDPGQVRDRHAAHYASLALPRHASLAQTDVIAGAVLDLHNTLVAWDWAIGRRNLSTIWALESGLSIQLQWLPLHRLGLDVLAAGASALTAGAPLSGEAATVAAMIRIGEADQLVRLGFLSRAAARLAEAGELLAGGDPESAHWREARFHYLRRLAMIEMNEGRYAEAALGVRASLAALEQGNGAMWPYHDDVVQLWHADAYQRQAWIAINLGEFEEARSFAEQGLAICEQLGLAGLASTLKRVLVRALASLGELEEAEQRGLAALAAVEHSTDVRLYIYWWLVLSQVYATWRKWEPAQAFLDRAQSTLRALPEPIFPESPDAWRQAGDLALARGDLAAAQRAYNECISVRLATNPAIWGWAVGALAGLGQVALALGDTEAAMRYLRQALAAQGPEAQVIARTLLCMGEASAAAGEYERAAELTAFVLHWRGTPWATRGAAAAQAQALEARLPPELMAQATTRGKARRLDELVAELIGQQELIGS